MGGEWQAQQAAGIEGQDWTGRQDAKLAALNALGAANPYKDQWLKETKLSSNQQAIFDGDERTDGIISGTKERLAGVLGQKLGADVDTSGLQGWKGLDYSGIHGPEWLDRAGMRGIRTEIGGAGEGIVRDVGPADFSADRQRVEQAMLSRMQGSFDRQRADMDAKLAAQGVSQGSQAYGAAADEINRGMNDARMSAVLAGGQEQSRLFGLSLDRAGFANQAQAQAFSQRGAEAQFGNAAQAQEFGQRADLAAQHNALRDAAIREQVQAAGFSNDLRQARLAERLQLRSQPINEISALFGLGGQVQVQMPGRSGAGSGGGVQVQASDLQGAIQNGYNQRASAAASKNGASAQAAGAAMSAATQIAVAI